MFKNLIPLATLTTVFIAVYYTSWPEEARCEFVPDAVSRTFTGADICWVTETVDCEIPQGDLVCADGLKMCMNNVCPTASGFEKWMESYTRATIAATGANDMDQEYEPLICFIGRPCGCKTFTINNIEYNLCIQTSEDPDYYGPHVFNSFATGASCDVAP